MTRAFISRAFTSPHTPPGTEHSHVDSLGGPGLHQGTHGIPICYLPSRYLVLLPPPAPLLGDSFGPVTKEHCCQIWGVHTLILTHP